MTNERLALPPSSASSLDVNLQSGTGLSVTHVTDESSPRGLDSIHLRTKFFNKRQSAWQFGAGAAASGAK
jgi:hypothetical protein